MSFDANAPAWRPGEYQKASGIVSPDLQKFGSADQRHIHVSAPAFVSTSRSSPAVADIFAQSADAMNKYASGSTSSLPYWSPASRIPQQQQQQQQQQLYQQRQSHHSKSLNSSAKEWRPTVSSSSSDATTGAFSEAGVGRAVPTEAEDSEDGMWWTAAEQVSQSKDLHDNDDSAAAAAHIPVTRRLTVGHDGDRVANELREMDIESSKQMHSADERYKEIPSRYFCAYPLQSDSSPVLTNRTFGYPSSLYKVCVFLMTD